MDVADMSEMDLNELLQAATSSYVESQRAKMLAPTTTLAPQRPPAIDNTISAAAGSQVISSTASSDSSSMPPPLKKAKKRINLPDFLHFHRASVNVLSPVDYQSLFQCQDHENDSIADTKQDEDANPPIVTRSPSYLEHLLNAIGHPIVLKTISQQFLKNVTQNPPK